MTLLGIYFLTHRHPKLGAAISSVGALGWMVYASVQPNAGILGLNAALFVMFIHALHNKKA